MSQIIAGGRTDDGWPTFSMEEYVGVRIATSEEAVGAKERQVLGDLAMSGYLSQGEGDDYSVTGAFLEVVAQFAQPAEAS